MEDDGFHGQDVRLRFANLTYRAPLTSILSHKGRGGLLLEQELSFRHHHGLPPYLDLLNRIIIGEHLDRNP